jgi:periplasmic protein TonB
MLGRRWSALAGIGVALLVCLAGCSTSATSSSSQQEGTQPYVKPVDVECSSIKAPKLEHHVNPRYPEEVRRQRLQGAVIVQGILGTDGIVSDITVLQSPSRTLSDLAVEAVKQWRYTPAYCHDIAKPIRVQLTVTSTFRLNQK